MSISCSRINISDHWDQLLPCTLSNNIQWIPQAEGRIKSQVLVEGNAVISSIIALKSCSCSFRHRNIRQQRIQKYHLAKINNDSSKNYKWDEGFQYNKCLSKVSGRLSSITADPGLKALEQNVTQMQQRISRKDREKINWRSNFKKLENPQTQIAF